MTRESRPLRVLELRAVRGTGGGPEKTILLGTARTPRERCDITVCYLRDIRDEVFAVDTWASQLGVRYVELRERHALDPATWRALRDLVRDAQIDIVHGHDYKTDLLAWLLARRGGPRALATAHGWTGDSPRERRLYYPADRWLLARFPRVIAVSSEIRRALLASGARPDRVLTIPNGIDASAWTRHTADTPAIRASLGLPPDAVVVGSVGRLEAQKRFDLLCEAFAVLASAHATAHLVIAGDGSRRPSLEAWRAAHPSLAPRVHLLGQRTDIAALHHAFDVFVQTSDYEGTPNAVLEAMAMGTPVVATDAGGTRDIAEHDVHALIVPCGDAGALAAAIARLLADRPRADALAQVARRHVEQALSFDARVARVEAVYHALMHESTA